MKMGVIIVVLTLFVGVVFSQHRHDPPSNGEAVNEHNDHPTEHLDIDGRIPIEVSEIQQRRIGLKVLKVRAQEAVRSIRTFGVIAVDQAYEAHVHSKISGWIEKLYADEVGKFIKKDDPLYELYSPELLSTQEEYITARQRADGAEIARLALERLRLWGVAEQSIAQLQKARRPLRTLLFVSPVSGFILDKSAIQGIYIGPELELFHIADLSRLWLILTFYESDVNLVKAGDEVSIKLPYDPSYRVQGSISYIYPEIDPLTRTGRARVEIDNSDQTIKPGMFANGNILKNLGQRIVVPTDAVIETGEREIVFVRHHGNRFEPREVTIGSRTQQGVIILAGLEENEEIVIMAQFLIDSESKLQAAIQAGGFVSPGHGEH